MPHFKFKSSSRLRDTIVAARDRALLALEEGGSASQASGMSAQASAQHTALLRLLKEYDFEQQQVMVEIMETAGLDVDAMAALLSIKTDISHSLGEIEQDQWAPYERLIGLGFAESTGMRYPGKQRGIALTTAGKIVLMLLPDVRDMPSTD